MFIPLHLHHCCFQTFITSGHCYGFVFGLPAFPPPSLQFIFFTAARVIFPKFNSTVPISKGSPIAKKIKFKLSITAFRALHSLALAILSKPIFCCVHSCCYMLQLHFFKVYHVISYIQIISSVA